MASVYLHGSYFGNNFGDVLLVDVFAKKIADMGYDVILPFAATSYAKMLASKVELGRGKDVVAGVFCGGGYFGEPSQGKKLWSLRNTLRHGRPYLLFKREAIPYSIVGVGFGPVSNQPYKAISNVIFRDANYIAVRDEESFLYAKKNGIDKDIKIFSDAIVSLTRSDIPPPSLEYADKVLKEMTSDDKYLVGIHITDKYEDENCFSNMCEALGELSVELPNWHFFLICDGKSRKGKKLKQEVDAERVAEYLPASRVSFVKYTTHWDMVALLSRLNMVVTSKLHVGIVSSALNVNVVSIPYHTKTKRFYSQIGCPERCLSDAVSKDKIADHLRLFSGREGVVIPEDVVRLSNENFKNIELFLGGLS